MSTADGQSPAPEPEANAEPRSFAEALAAQPPLPDALPNVSNARILEIAGEEGIVATHVYVPGFEFDHEQLFGFVKRVVGEASAPALTKAEWRAAAERVYLEAGDDEDVAIACARALCHEQDWDSEDNPADPVEAAREDVRGRPASVALCDPQDSAEPWYAYIPELAAVYGEICAIHETPAKDQTPEQKERLKVLRAECVASHNVRIEANVTRNRAARALADRQRKLAAPPKAMHPAVAAIEFSLTQGEGDAFLRCWREGDWATIRKEWPEAPEAVFVEA